MKVERLIIIYCILLNEDFIMLGDQMSLEISFLIFCAICLTLFTVLGIKAYKDTRADEVEIHRLAKNSNLKPIDDD